MQFKFKIEQEIEKVADILNEKHLELLELLFPGWSGKFKSIESRILVNNITRVQITFRWKIKNRYSKFEINIKVCEKYLLFSLKTNKYLDNIFEDDFDILKLANYLQALGIEVKILTVLSRSPKNGANGQQHNRPPNKSGRSHGRRHKGKKKKKVNNK